MDLAFLYFTILWSRFKQIYLLFRVDILDSQPSAETARRFPAIKIVINYTMKYQQFPSDVTNAFSNVIKRSLKLLQFPQIQSPARLSFFLIQSAHAAIITPAVTPHISIIMSLSWHALPGTKYWCISSSTAYTPPTAIASTALLLSEILDPLFRFLLRRSDTLLPL